MSEVKYDILRVETERGPYFKVRRISSNCAYGFFATYEDAKDAISAANEADQRARCGQ